MKIYKEMFKPDVDLLAKRYVAEIIKQGSKDMKKSCKPCIHVVTLNKKRKVIKTNCWAFRVDMKELKCYLNEPSNPVICQENSDILYFHRNDYRSIGYNRTTKSVVRVSNDRAGFFEQPIENFYSETVLVIVENSMTIPPFIFSVKKSDFYKQLDLGDFCLASYIINKLSDFLYCLKDKKDTIETEYGDIKREFKEFKNGFDKSIVPFDIYKAITNFKKALETEYVEFYKDGEVKTYLNNETHMSMTSTRVKNSKVDIIHRTITCMDESTKTDVTIDKIVETFNHENNSYQYESTIYSRCITIYFSDDTWKSIKQIKVLNPMSGTEDYFDPIGQQIKTEQTHPKHKVKYYVDKEKVQFVYDYADITLTIRCNNIGSHNTLTISGKVFSSSEIINDADVITRVSGFNNKDRVISKSFGPHFHAGKMTIGKSCYSRFEKNLKISVPSFSEFDDSTFGQFDVYPEGNVDYYFSPLLTTKKYIYERSIYGIPYKFNYNYTNILRTFVPEIQLY